MAEFQEYISTITSKGQVTIPVAVRRALGVTTADKLVFRISEGRVEVEPLPMSLDEAFASVAPLDVPMDFEQQRQQAREERVEKYANKQNS